jgi:rare lipoprotein A
MNKLTKILIFGFGIALSCFLYSFTSIKKVSNNEWHGIASYYHPKFNGRKTSTGEIFSNTKFTAANNFLKLGTLVRVTNKLNGSSVVVKINDRMNKSNKRLIDLSQAAAKKLGLIQQGVGEVILEVIDFEDQIANVNTLWNTRS